MGLQTSRHEPDALLMLPSASVSSLCRAFIPCQNGSERLVFSLFLRVRRAAEWTLSAGKQNICKQTTTEDEIGCRWCFGLLWDKENDLFIFIKGDSNSLHYLLHSIKYPVCTETLVILCDFYSLQSVKMAEFCFSSDVCVLKYCKEEPKQAETHEEIQSFDINNINVVIIQTVSISE